LEIQLSKQTIRISRKSSKIQQNQAIQHNDLNNQP
jgi:hypothetical protein